MHVVSEGRAFYLLPNVFFSFFLRYPIANKANMKGGGSEMPAKRKMRKERRKDKQKKTKKMLNTSPCFCFNLCYTEGQRKAIRKNCSQLH